MAASLLADLRAAAAALLLSAILRRMQRASFQEAFYSADVDYTIGSPHLSNLPLRARLTELLRASVGDLIDRGLPLTVLEIGAGHGGYTEAALALGCEVTAVEMSQPSLDVLRARFGSNPALSTIYDPTGELAGAEGRFALVLAVSVLHHIPDYETFLRSAAERVLPGGGLLTMQDPLWYSRSRPAQHAADRGAYLAWRLRRGDLITGLASFRRRVTGRLDESKPGDMVEYHVVRNGVDEVSLASAVRDGFEQVELVKYWSNQLGLAQRTGTRLGWTNTFALSARGRYG